jgi:hypothetical protein
MSKGLKIFLVVAALTVFAVSTALAIGLPGVPGASKLKKETKSFTLGDLDPSLKAFEGKELDPVKADKKFACNVFGDAEYDKVAIAVTKIELATAFANNVLADANPKIDAAKSPADLKAVQANLDAAQKVVTALTTACKSLVDGAKSCATGLPSKATSGRSATAPTLRT